MPQLIVNSRLHVLAHRGLEAPCSVPGTPLSALLVSLDRVDFVDDVQLAAPGDPRLPVLMPVFSELQADRLRALRVRHPAALLVAVTDCVSGHLTYQAIRAGANFAFNLAITDERQIDLLLAQFRAHRPPGARRSETRLCALPDGALSAPAAARASVVPAGYDADLLRMLCSSATVSEIARRTYCSERSMYRRIRKLYNAFGVSGRSALLARAVELGLVDDGGGPGAQIRRAG
ncbi:hypothetical protein SUDANB105_06605 [Streptomyces sp. enrichment culture]|uniref:helix-turn-helix transcriptional regulator n=1 Tax=Streptomyces sp. enrichment culture TaxID=1795815 RepID=UPI003F55D073